MLQLVGGLLHPSAQEVDTVSRPFGGRYVFTASLSDRSVYLWEVSPYSATSGTQASLLLCLDERTYPVLRLGEISALEHSMPKPSAPAAATTAGVAGASEEADELQLTLYVALAEVPHEQRNDFLHSSMRDAFPAVRGPLCEEAAAARGHDSSDEDAEEESSLNALLAFDILLKRNGHGQVEAAASTGSCSQADADATAQAPKSDALINNDGNNSVRAVEAATSTVGTSTSPPARARDIMRGRTNNWGLTGEDRLEAPKSDEKHRMEEKISSPIDTLLMDLGASDDTADPSDDTTATGPGVSSSAGGTGSRGQDLEINGRSATSASASDEDEVAPSLSAVVASVLRMRRSAFFFPEEVTTVQCFFASTTVSSTSELSTAGKDTAERGDVSHWARHDAARERSRVTFRAQQLAVTTDDGSVAVVVDDGESLTISERHDWLHANICSSVLPLVGLSSSREDADTTGGAVTAGTRGDNTTNPSKKSKKKKKKAQGKSSSSTHCASQICVEGTAGGSEAGAEHERSDSDGEGAEQVAADVREIETLTVETSKTRAPTPFSSSSSFAPAGIESCTQQLQQQPPSLPAPQVHLLSGGYDQMVRLTSTETRLGNTEHGGGATGAALVKQKTNVADLRIPGRKKDELEGVILNLPFITYMRLLEEPEGTAPTSCQREKAHGGTVTVVASKRGSKRQGQARAQREERDAAGRQKEAADEIAAPGAAAGFCDAACQGMKAHPTAQAGRPVVVSTASPSSSSSKKKKKTKGALTTSGLPGGAGRKVRVAIAVGDGFVLEVEPSAKLGKSKVLAEWQAHGGGVAAFAVFGSSFIATSHGKCVRVWERKKSCKSDPSSGAGDVEWVQLAEQDGSETGGNIVQHLEFLDDKRLLVVDTSKLVRIYEICYTALSPEGKTLKVKYNGSRG